MKKLFASQMIAVSGMMLSLVWLGLGCPGPMSPGNGNGNAANDNGNAGNDNENNNGSTSSLIFPEDYSSFTEVRDCRISIDNHPENIRVLVNDIGAQAYLDDENPLPEGTIIVKEIYEGVLCGDDAELIGIAAMRKMEAGFDPDDNDWRWQEVEMPSQTILFDTKETCVACHAVLPECLDRDYICTEE